MKKVILSAFCLFSSLALVGCGGVSDAEANKNVNLQLDRVNSVVSSQATETIEQVSPSDYLANENNSKLLSQRNNCLYNAKNEKKLKEEILQTVSRIKNIDQKNLKLGNDKAGALKSLSQNINKYLNYLGNSKNDLYRSVKKIRNNDKIENTNIESLNANFVELNNNLKEREAYLQNLLSSLQEVEKIYNCAQNTAAQTNSAQNSTSSKSFTPNVDSYHSQTSQNSTDNFSSNTQNNNNPNVAEYNSNNFNRAYNNYNYNGNALGRQNNYYGYGYGYNYPRYNPDRNTDTYAPFARNTDTYRMQPNNYFGRPIMAGQTQQSPSQTDQEKVKEVEKEIESKSNKKHFAKHKSEEKKENANKNQTITETKKVEKQTLQNAIDSRFGLKHKRPIARPMSSPKIIKEDKTEGSKVI